MLKFLFELYNTNPQIDGRFKELLKEAKSKVAKYFGIPEYLLNLRHAIARLPEIYEVGIRRIGGYLVGYVRKIGKVLGAFDPLSDSLLIDPINFCSERRLRKTIFHEVVHAAQKILGKLYRLPRALVEKEAYLVTQKLVDS